MEGSISIPRNIAERSWSNSPITVYVFIRLVMKANWKESSWLGEPVGRGELVTSIASLSKELGIKDSQTRYALKCLREDKRITCDSTNQFTKITICEYDSYQFSKKTDCQTIVQTEVQTDVQTNNERSSNIRIKEIKEERDKTEKDNNKSIDCFSDDVVELYKLYPTKCPECGRSTQKGTSSKRIIERLLKKFNEGEIAFAINYYLSDCKKSKTYIKNFDTLLHKIEKGDIPTNTDEQEQVQEPSIFQNEEQKYWLNGRKPQE